MSKFGLQDLIITDDSIPRVIQQKITSLVQGPIWQYGWRSNTRRDRFCFWHASFAGGGIESRTSCEAELSNSPNLAPIYSLWKSLEEGVLKGHEPLRVYANGHTFGVEGYVHIDNKDDENYFSTIYYAHPVWHKNWCGDTVFYAPGGQDILASIYPKPGRSVTFHGSIPHCARAPGRDCNELRISVVIKTQLKEG